MQHCIDSGWIQVILIELSKGFFDALFLNQEEFLQAYRSTGLRQAILPIPLCTLLVNVLFLQVFGEIPLLAPTLDAGFRFLLFHNSFFFEFHCFMSLLKVSIT